MHTFFHSTNLLSGTLKVRISSTSTSYAYFGSEEEENEETKL